MTRLSSLRRRMLHCAAALAFLGALPLPAGAAAPLAAPASAMLTYKLKASAKGFMINVDSQLDWKREGDTYHLTNRGSFMVFSFMFESTGRVDAQGVQPARYQETRNRRVKSVDFDPKGGVRYSGGAQEPFQAGIQDRMSVLMQLAALGRGNPGAFAAGKVATFRVAGSSQSDNWHFKVVGNEELDTAMGKIKAVHLERERDHDDGQKIEVWLSAEHDWLPVRVLSKEANGDYLDQVVSKIER